LCHPLDSFRYYLRDTIARDLLLKFRIMIGNQPHDIDIQIRKLVLDYISKVNR
jgi:hypothetical protein